jgi:hypothetical protein
MNTMTNSTVVSAVVKSLACGAAALAITAVVGLGFVQATESVPGTVQTVQAPRGHVHGRVRLGKLSIERGHTLFGQPEPAVLVD